MNTKMSFGKAIEYKVASEMIREGFEVYLPTVDDHGVDIVARTSSAGADSSKTWTWSTYLHRNALPSYKTLFVAGIPRAD